MREVFPTISAVIPTHNSAKTITDCIKSVLSQNYPSQIEILIIDGSSTDETTSLAKDLGVTVINVPKYRQNAEYNKSIGVNKAKHDLILMLDSDNILPHSNWLRNMVYPFLKEKNLVGSDPAFIHYDRKHVLIDRYLALFGSLDPVAFYLGKSDKLPRYSDSYSFFKTAKKKKGYYLAAFYPEFVPAIGSNGFLMSREIVARYGKTEPKHFFHTDIHVDIIKNGYRSYAFVLDSITHLTGVRSLGSFLYRRVLFARHNLQQRNFRRHSVFMPQDTLRLMLFILYTLTVIKPLYDSVRGYVKIRDRAWFLHPVLCFAFLFLYGYVVMETTYKKLVKA